MATVRHVLGPDVETSEVRDLEVTAESLNVRLSKSYVSCKEMGVGGSRHSLRMV